MVKIELSWTPIVFTATPIIGGFVGNYFVRPEIKGWYEVNFNIRPFDK